MRHTGSFIQKYTVPPKYKSLAGKYSGQMAKALQNTQAISLKYITALNSLNQASHSDTQYSMALCTWPIACPTDGADYTNAFREWIPHPDIYDEDSPFIRDYLKVRLTKEIDDMLCEIITTAYALGFHFNTDTKVFERRYHA